MRVADARDFKDQAAVMEDVGDADAMLFPEIGVALVSGNAAQERGMSAMSEIAADSPYESIDPEYFVFPSNVTAEFLRGYAEKTQTSPGDYLRGFLQAAEQIAKEFGYDNPSQIAEEDEETMSLGVTWGLRACKVPPACAAGTASG